MIDNVLTWEEVLSRIDVRTGMALATSRPAREVFRDGGRGGLWRPADVVEAMRSTFARKRELTSGSRLLTATEPRCMTGTPAEPMTRALRLWARHMTEYLTRWGSPAYTREKRRQVWRMTKTLLYD